MPTPKVYLTASETVITAGAGDLTTGRNVVNLYAGTAQDPDTLDGFELISGSNIISNLEFESLRKKTTILGGPIDVPLNFNMEFKDPQIIEGQTMVQVPYSVIGSGIPGSGSALISLYKVDIAGTETLLDEDTTKTIYAPASTEVISGSTLNLKIPRTKFSKGEKLLLRCRWSPRISVAPTIYHDPKNGAITGAPYTALIIQAPFEPK